MTKVNSNNINETKSDIIHGTYSNLALFFVVCKILIYFNGFLIGIFQFQRQFLKKARPIKLKKLLTLTV